MKSSKTLGAAVALSAAALWMPNASAALITNWDFTNTLGFSAFAPAGVIPAGVEGSIPNPNADPTLLEWGTGFGQPNPSSLELLNNSGTPGVFTGSEITNDGISQLEGQLHHSNFPINGTTLTSFTVNGQLNLDPTNPDLPAFDLPPVDFFAAFVETENSAPCGFPSGSVCDDIFVLLNPGALSVDFLSLMGYIYTIDVTLTGLVGLDALSCAEAGQAANCVGFKTEEGTENTLNVNFEITAREVPEPISLALLGIGFVGLGLARRRVKRNGALIAS